MARAQTTFQNPNAPSGYQSWSSRPSSGYISGFASLIGGLFSVPANTVVTYIQSFLGSSQPTPKTPPPTQTQPVIVQNIVLAPNTLIAPPSPDILAQILAIGNQQGKNLPSTVQKVTAADTTATVSPAPSVSSTPQEQTTNPTTVPGNESRPAKSAADLLPSDQVSTLSDSRKEADATSTESTSSPRWIEPEVVEVGVPVDITYPAIYESVLAYINGDWTQRLRTATQNKAALAQAESERAAIVAYIESLQEARAAGICDEMCSAALSALQRDLPEWQSRVDELQTAVRKDAEPQPVPPPTVGQISRVADSLVSPLYEVPSVPAPRSASAPPAVVSVSSQETLPPPSEVKGEATILRIVRGIWESLKSWFLPSAQAPREKCSLFLSLFGRCK